MIISATPMLPLSMHIVSAVYIVSGITFTITSKYYICFGMRRCFTEIHFIMNFFSAGLRGYPEAQAGMRVVADNPQGYVGRGG